MRSLVLMVALAGVTSLTACTGSQAGAPRAAAQATPTTSAQTSLPPRPHALPLDGVDPCTLITEQQRAVLAIDRPPLGDKQSGGLLGNSPTCNYRSSNAEYSFLITSGTTIGLAEFLDQARPDPTRRTIKVNDFPAVQDELLAGPGNDTCFVDVDVADDQLLEVQFGQIGSSKPLPMETLCAKAVEVAEAALTTLQELR